MTVKLPERGSLTDITQNLFAIGHSCPTNNIDTMVEKKGCQRRRRSGQDNKALRTQRERRSSIV